MTWAAGKRIVREEVKRDARTKGSRHGAEENLNAFYQLSFLLTRDHERAERCFVAGIEHLVRGNFGAQGLRANCLRAVRPGSLFSRRLCRPSWLLDFRNSASPYARSAGTH